MVTGEGDNWNARHREWPNGQAGIVDELRHPRASKLQLALRTAACRRGSDIVTDDGKRGAPRMRLSELKLPVAFGDGQRPLRVVPPQWVEPAIPSDLARSTTHQHEPQDRHWKQDQRRRWAAGVTPRQF